MNRRNCNNLQPETATRFQQYGAASQNLIAAKAGVSTANLEFDVAPIWAHESIVEGAQDVVGSYEPEGDEHARVNLYAITLDNEHPITSVHVAGDVWLGVTDVMLVVSDDEPTAAPRESNVVVSDIVGGATTNLVINTAITVYRKPNSQIISMPIPGTLEYDTDMVALASTATLDVEALQTYLVSETDSEKVFLLPNGAVIYTDSDGVVARVIEDGIDVTLSDYAITTSTAGHLVAKLGPGVSIDLVDGIITIDEGSSLEILVSSIKGSWLKGFIASNGDNSEIGKVVVYSEGVNELTGEPEITAVRLTASLLMTTDDGIEYYQLVGAGTSYLFSAAFGVGSPASISAAVYP